MFAKRNRSSEIRHSRSSTNVATCHGWSSQSKLGKLSETFWPTYRTDLRVGRSEPTNFPTLSVPTWAENLLFDQYISRGYMSKQYMSSPGLDRELKKGSAELLILSLVED